MESYDGRTSAGIITHDPVSSSYGPVSSSRDPVSSSQDRAHRIGQRNEVRVFRLVTASEIEEKILARATDKKTLNSLAVEAGQFNRSGAKGVDDKKEIITRLEL